MSFPLFHKDRANAFLIPVCALLRRRSDSSFENLFRTCGARAFCTGILMSALLASLWMLVSVCRGSQSGVCYIPAIIFVLVMLHAGDAQIGAQLMTIAKSWATNNNLRPEHGFRPEYVKIVCLFRTKIWELLKTTPCMTAKQDLYNPLMALYMPKVFKVPQVTQVWDSRRVMQRPEVKARGRWPPPPKNQAPALAIPTMMNIVIIDRSGLVVKEMWLSYIARGGSHPWPLPSRSVNTA